jgi:hypothetical protein
MIFTGLSSTIKIVILLECGKLNVLIYFYYYLLLEKNVLLFKISNLQ